MRHMILFALAMMALVAPVGASEAPELLGFSTAAAAEQRELELRFDAQLSADNLRQWAERLARRPHHVGSPWGKANAEWIAEQFRSWGYETRIETFEVLFPTPIERRVRLLEPHIFEPTLAEPTLDEDAHLRAEGRAASDLQRLLDRRRRDR